MNPKSGKSRPDPFRPAGSFNWNGHTVTLLISRKSGEAMFEMEGKRVDDPETIQALSEHFQLVNQKDRK